MNSLYNLALRQSSSLQADLARLDADPAGVASAALQGQLTTTFSAFTKTVEDYEGMARKELVMSKQEKALERVKKFREEEKELKTQFERLKNRAKLGPVANGSGNANGAGASSSYSVRSPTGNGFPGAPAESPYAALHARGPSNHPANATHGYQPHTSIGGLDTGPADPRAAYKMNASAAAMFANGSGSGFSARESHALREHSFVEQTENQLDAFISQGKEVWENLVEQRQILKGTRRKLLDAANTLGLSRDVIGYIERRSTQDNILFGIGAIFTLVCFYYIYKWFG